MLNQSPEPEETPTPAVSSLRSKFEKLAVASSSTTSLNRYSGNFDLLSPDSGSPRPRSASISDERPPTSPRSLRAASSSSDLKIGGKRPPPPVPPPRSSRGNSPSPSVNTSPLLRPEPAGSGPPSPTSTLAVNKVALLQRKPPPPPPSGANTPAHESSPTPGGSGVASLISKFGNVASPLHPTRSPHPTPRVVSLTSPGTPTNGAGSVGTHLEGGNRAPRHSFPLTIPPGSPAPLIQLESPFDEGPTSAVEAPPTARPPPPLPTRKAGGTPANIERVVIQDKLVQPESDHVALSGEADPLATVISPPRPPHHPPPPRPPPRPKTSGGTTRRTGAESLITPDPHSPSVTPPPLPARKATAQAPEDTGVRRVPPPPRHHSVFLAEAKPRISPPAADVAASPLQESPIEGATITSPPPVQTTTIIQPTERKAFGSHLPPPTRTIALGDKLPPARRQPSGSSSEEDEDDLKVKVELLPDSSRASRKPPNLDVFPFPESNIWVPAHHGAVAAAGHIVAVSQVQHLKIYDLSEKEAPILDLDARGLGIESKAKDFKITSLEFRCARKESDRGAYLWIGTNNGHLLELDIRAGLVIGMKLAAHSHSVTHIFRHAQSMVTLDETGKALVFTPEAQAELDVGLAYTPPRVVRIADKQEFVRMLAGRLWTSARDSASTSRGPIVRVYDIFTPGTVGKSLLPSEHLGTVTSGAVMQSQPNRVYLGHEGGNISIWALDTEDGLPAYEEVVKVSTSGVLSLEGVHDRLWSGGRMGVISVYDVTTKPWTVTNHWKAHKDLPVHRVVADPWSIEKLGKFSVYSFGRDEKIQFWDGLLGIDWIDQELEKREKEFSTFRDLTVLIVSWNMDSARPDHLQDTNPNNFNFLRDVLSSVESPDIIMFGFQELVDLESRKVAAKNVLLNSGKNRSSDALSERVTTAYRKWHDRLTLALRTTMPLDDVYSPIHTDSMVGLLTCAFVKNSQRGTLRKAHLTSVKRGMGGRYGNKGGILCRFVLDDTSICFINCHLAAGQGHIRQRNADVASFFEEKQMFIDDGAPEEPVMFINGGDGSRVLDHEIVFINGDMNYRIDLRRDAAIADIKAGNFSHLLSQDQLMKEMKLNRGFRLRTFQEGPLTFAPTYKYDRRTDEYDSSEKKRVPAWCDRILWRSREPSRVKQLHYRRWEVNISDHRPISSAFRITVKSISPANRQLVKTQAVASWADHEKIKLSEVYQFYASQGFV